MKLDEKYGNKDTGYKGSRIQKNPDSIQRLKEVYEWRKKKFHDAARREKVSELLKLFH